VSDVEDISLMVVIMSGLCKKHSISSLDHIDLEILMICEFSYFYPMFVNENEEEDCENISHVCLQDYQVDTYINDYNLQ
jgi:hypothetical protein